MSETYANICRVLPRLRPALKLAGANLNSPLPTDSSDLFRFRDSLEDAIFRTRKIVRLTSHNDMMAAVEPLT